MTLLVQSSLTLAESATHVVDVPGWVTGLFSLLLVMMVASLAFEELLHAKKSIIVGTYAGLSLVLATVLSAWLEIELLPFGDVTLPNGHHISMPVYIPGIDWSVITVILGASLFVEVTSRSGLFSWLAIKLTKKSGGDPWMLLVYYGSLTVIFSAVLNNVTAMIIIGSLTAVSLKKLSREELLLGFLVVEGLLTNVGGLLTLISSVPNIIVGKTAQITFVKFFFIASPYVVVSTIITLIMGRMIFRIQSLKTEEERETARELVSGFDEKESVPNQTFFWTSAGVLILFILTLAGQSALPWRLSELGMGFVALFYAGVMLLAYRHEVNKYYAAMDWDLLSFFAGLFVFIYVLEQALVLDMIGGWIQAMLTLPGWLAEGCLLCSSAIASSVTDNIPLAAMLAKILKSMELESSSSYWWCVIFGCNLGGNLTPIGSASTVVAMTIIHKQKLPLSFGGFVVMALPFAAVQILIALIYVEIFL